ncbi:S41 family peptidase [Enterococcus faecalis]
MKSKRTIPYYQYIISILCTAFLVGGACYIYFDYRLQKMSTTGDLAKVQDLYDEITNNYVGKVDKSKLVDGALQGMAAALDDPYSSYLTEPAANELSKSLSGSFEGIGATMAIKDNYPTVMEVPVKNSPAEKAGLKTNDVIVKVDGQSTEGVALSEVVSKIRGKKGTSVNLSIRRGEQTFDIDVKRAEVPMETIYSKMDEHDATVGYLKISTFGKQTAQELQTKIKHLRKAGAKAFVIDVRQNPGGLLDQAEQMASMFLKNGQTIVQFEDKNGQRMKEAASKKLDGGFKVTEPVAVVVDESSASAAEIFAAALKEAADIPVVGTKTFGKGTVQSVKNLQDKTELKLTVLKWLTPSGQWLHEKGLAPSIRADFPEYAYLKPIPRDQVLKEGTQSEAIKNLHGILAALGYSVDQTSTTFDSATKTAVADIQKQNQLPVDGEVSPATATKIEAMLGKLILEHDVAYNTALKAVKK